MPLDVAPDNLPGRKLARLGAGLPEVGLKLEEHLLSLGVYQYAGHVDYLLTPEYLWADAYYQVLADNNNSLKLLECRDYGFEIQGDSLVDL